MGTKKIYLIRHGQTDLNLKGIVQGRSMDPPLNAAGRAQATAFYHAYKKVSFDAVYTSALKRSVESVRLFIELGIPHYTLAGLNEIDWGKQEGKKMTLQSDAYYYTLIKQWRKGLTDICIEGGESPSQVAARQKKAVRTILGENHEKTILICMHGRAMRILLCQLLNYPLSKMDIFSHQNMGLYVLHYTGSIFCVETFNDTSHL